MRSKQRPDKQPSRRTRPGGMKGPWAAATAPLRDANCVGAGSIRLVAAEPFWDEADLPFAVHGGGAALRVVPKPGFRRESLASTLDEALLVVPCPDAPGWLAPSDLVADWMARFLRNEELDDLLLAHPLYEHLTHNDPEGRSRGGRAVLAHWSIGVPTVVVLAPPEFLPDDPDAPAVNRIRADYADAVGDLLEQLATTFPLLEAEVAVRLVAPGSASASGGGSTQLRHR